MWTPEDNLPVVPVPSDEKMERRKLLRSLSREKRCRVQAINRLHALFVSRGITTIVKKDLCNNDNRLQVLGQLTGIEREEANHLVLCLKMYEDRIKSIKKEISDKVKGDKNIELLKTVPGVGEQTAFAFDAHVDVERFDNAAQVSNYIGLVPRVYMSGDISRYGNITKRGNSELRFLLVEGAWALVRSKNGGALKERFMYMTVTKGMSKKKAIVAIARRLAALLYTMLKTGTEYEVRKFKTPKNSVSAALAGEAA
jgi:transposase